MKKRNSFIGLVLIIVLATLYFNTPDYKSGSCIEDYRDGYVWYVSDYGLFTYTLLGWQGDSWGNPVDLEKSIMERKTAEEIPIYHLTSCPSFKPH